MAECISNLEYVVERNGGSTRPYKKLKELVKHIKQEEADLQTPYEDIKQF
jgi:hypothetical protein